MSSLVLYRAKIAAVLRPPILIGLATLPFAPETKGRPLPE